MDSRAPGGRWELTYILPVHNETATLRQSVTRIYERLRTLSVAAWRILLVENGSRDASAALVSTLAEEYARAHNGGEPPVLAFAEPEAGIGVGYYRGIQEALDRFGEGDDHWIVLTAADIPFGFSDLEAFLAAQPSQPRVSVFIGSKAHPKSHVDTSPRRKLASAVFRALTWSVLRLKTRDSQGVFFLRASYAAMVCPSIRSRDFFYSTELVYRSERAGESIVELPVHYVAEKKRQSTVRLGRDGLRVARKMLDLRWRGLERS
jgi:glycosyltransferase involved in cell wall biosynthesis